VHVILTQLNVKDRLNAYGVSEDAAILKKLKQLHVCVVFIPRNREEMLYLPY